MEFTPEYVEYMPPKEEMNPTKIYISRKFGCSIHLCACGCGEEACLDFKPFWKDGWDLIEKDGKVTFSPSILNRFCGSHYFIRDNQVVWA
jgi:hypothetical protein